jgi:hypothetical protein
MISVIDGVGEEPGPILLGVMNFLEFEDGSGEIRTFDWNFFQTFIAFWV